MTVLYLPPNASVLADLRDEAGPNRVDTVGHHGRDRLGFALDRGNRRVIGSHDHVDLAANELMRELRKSLGSALAVANLQHVGLPFDIAELPQPLFERLHKRPSRCRGGSGNVPDPRDLGRLLRVDKGGPCEGGVEEGGDERDSRFH